MDEMTIGKRIQRLRKARGLTQEQLAERVGVSAQAVSKWENDNSCPDISLLAELSKVLGVTTDELLGCRSEHKDIIDVSASPAEDEPKHNAEPAWDDDEDEENDSDDRPQVFSMAMDWGPGKHYEVFLGLFVVTFGVLLVLHKSMALFPCGLWNVTWPTALILLLGLPGVIARRPSLFGVGMTAIGVYALLANLNVISFRLEWWVIMAAVLVMIGLSILSNALSRKSKHHHSDAPDGKHRVHINDDKAKINIFSQKNGFITMTGRFCDIKRRMQPDQFRGADVNLSFGDADLDLTTLTSVAPDAVLNCEVSFGDLNVYLPRSVRIIEKGGSSFGDISVEGQCRPDAPYALIVNADVSFGDLTIRYR